MSDTATVPGVEQAVALGLTRDEYALVVDKLGREPNEVELAMFSLLWSEHCAYKHSKKLLRTLPTEGPRVVMGPGENAGAVDVGDGLAVAFKVESHNHPSAVEPFQGAATGVGGILRDIFAIGARPIAVLDSLRFGEPTSERSRYLLDRAVAGIGHYGNSIGVPTIGGEVYFEAPYETNCLVNAMALGLARRDDMVRSAAAGVGNLVILFGASTGRDGIGGASVLASAELDEDDESKRPSVQVGDPFEENKLIECSLELLERGLLVSLQDLGAAGLTSSASRDGHQGRGRHRHRRRARAAARGRHGAVRDHGLRVAGADALRREPERVDEVLAVCAKWEVHGTAIGEVTDTRHMRILRGGEVVGDMPVAALVDDCPLYDLAPEAPDASRSTRAPAATLAAGASIHDTLLALLASPNIASRRPLFEQYDCLVGARTVRRPEQADAAVLALPDGNAHRRVDRRQRPPRRRRPLPRHDRRRPRVRGEPRLRRRRAARPDQQPELRQPREAAHRLAAHRVGPRPRRRLPRARRAGRRRQRLALQRGRRRPDLPDAGRRHGRRPARPACTPRAAASRARATRSASPARTAMPSLAASELAKLRGEPLPDGLPELDLDHAAKVLAAIRDAVRAGDLATCHDVAEGGLLIAMAEACLAGGVGARIDPIDDRRAR